MESIRHSCSWRTGRPSFAKVLVWNAAFAAIAMHFRPFSWACVMASDPAGVWFPRLHFLFPNVRGNLTPVPRRTTESSCSCKQQKHEGRSEQNRRGRRNLASLLASFRFADLWYCSPLVGFKIATSPPTALEKQGKDIIQSAKERRRGCTAIQFSCAFVVSSYANKSWPMCTWCQCRIYERGKREGGTQAWT